MRFTAGTPVAEINGVKVTLAEYGALLVRDDGAWAFAPATLSQKNALLALTQGQTLTITADVVGADKHGAEGVATLTIEIDGTNQPPSFVSGSLSLASSQTALPQNAQLSGFLNANDPDAGETRMYALTQSGQGVYGTFSVASDGAWTYTRNGASIAFMAKDVAYSETFMVSVADGQGATTELPFTLTIFGENDAPILSGTTQEAFVPAPSDGVVLRGRVIAHDPDINDAPRDHLLTAPVSAAVNDVSVGIDLYGTFVLHLDGSWELRSNALQQAALAALGTTQTLTLTAPTSVSDGNGATGTANIVVVVNGLNEPPVFDPAALEASVSENVLTANGVFSGVLLASDPDNDPLFFSVTNGVGAYGALSVSSGLGLATHNQLDATQSADLSPDVFYLDRSDGKLQGDDAVLIDAGVENISVFTYGGNDSITALGTVAGSVINAGTGADTLRLGSLRALFSDVVVRSESGTCVLGDTLVVGAAYGLCSTGGSNTLRADSVTISASAASSYGLYSSGGTNLLVAANANITALHSGSGSSFGMCATGAGAVNTLTSTTSLNAVVDAGTGATGSYYGMYAAAGGKNNIVGDSSGALRDVADITGNIVASAGGTNVFNMGSGADAATITGSLTASGGDNAITCAGGTGRDTSVSIGGGLTPNGTNAVSCSASGGSASITINGGVNSGIGGANLITTGSGADLVKITGGATGSGNVVNTGSGNDAIALDGVISTGGLKIAAGAGSDTLVLSATSTVNFNNRYMDWLTDMLNNTDHGIETILISGVNLIDLVLLTTLITAYNLLHAVDITLGTLVGGLAFTENTLSTVAADAPIYVLPLNRLSANDFEGATLVSITESDADDSANATSIFPDAVDEAVESGKPESAVLVPITKPDADDSADEPVVPAEEENLSAGDENAVAERTAANNNDLREDVPGEIDRESAADDWLALLGLPATSSESGRDVSAAPRAALESSVYFEACAPADDDLAMLAMILNSGG